MKPWRLLIFAVVALAQLSVPAWLIWMRTQTLTKGKVWKFRTAPVDPLDAVRGRYVALSFKAQQVPQAERLPPSSSAYALLREGASGFAEIERLSTTPVQGDNVMKVRPGSWWDGAQHVDFPLDRYWVNEKSAPAAERAYAANSRKQKDNAYVTVRVHNGDAAIEQLFIDDQPLPEYLRSHPAP
jgi:uncharacterized membrane-anchored protein